MAFRGTCASIILTWCIHPRVHIPVMVDLREYVYVCGDLTGKLGHIGAMILDELDDEHQRRFFVDCVG